MIFEFFGKGQSRSSIMTHDIIEAMLYSLYPNCYFLAKLHSYFTPEIVHKIVYNIIDNYKINQIINKIFYNIFSGEFCV